MRTPEGSSFRISVRKRFRLFFSVAVVVLLLSGLKVAVHALGLELLVVNSLYTSAIAGAIFIIGFLLSSVLADYKEADKIPADLRASLEGINSDVSGLAGRYAEFDAAPFRELTTKVIDLLQDGLGHRQGHVGLQPVLTEIDKFAALFAALDEMGVPSNAVVRLRGLQDSVRRSVLRIYHIQKMQFVPSAHVLVQTLVFAIILLLLLVKTEGAPESALLFGFISYMFVYALYLVRLLEQPFMKEHGSFDDVSLFLLAEYRATLLADGIHGAGREKP